MAISSQNTSLPESSTGTVAERPTQAAAALDSGAAARLVLVITFVLIFIMAARTPLDTDLWWHLRAGEETLRTGQPLLVDVFSFTRQGAHWINHSWLSQVGMALLYRWGGYLALGAAMALLATLSMLLVSLQCEGPAFLKAAALLLGSVVASVVWVPRPQLASLVLLALTGWILYEYKWRGRERPWLLLPVFILWSNLHGGYALGLLLGGALLAGELANHLLGLMMPQVLSWRRILRLGGWLVLCGLAVLINPNGLDTWRIPFQTVNVNALQQFIPEWASPDFHVLLHQTLLWLLFGVFAAFALSGQVVDASDLFTVLGFAWMALTARRNYGPFALVAVPVLVRYASAALRTWRERSPWLARLDRASDPARPESAGLRRFKTAINLGLVAVLAVAALGKLYVVTHPALVGSYESQGYPAQAVSWLAHNRPGERLLNEYNWGGYLAWKLPGSPVFLDGRTDLFGDELIGKWMETISAAPGWEDTLDQYQIRLVMLDPTRPLLQKLPGEGWKLLYQDAQAVIYGR